MFYQYVLSSCVEQASVNTEQGAKHNCKLIVKVGLRNDLVNVGGMRVLHMTAVLVCDSDIQGLVDVVVDQIEFVDHAAAKFGPALHLQHELIVVGVNLL